MNWRCSLDVEGTSYEFISGRRIAESFGGRIDALPCSLRVVLESIARCGGKESHAAIEALLGWTGKPPAITVDFAPSRVLMQDFTGVPALVDLAALRDAVKAKGGNPEWVNPQVPVDLVIDHSVMVDSYGVANAFETNVSQEFHRNQERYRFLKWGQQAFKNCRVVPPGTGICHQVNLEYLASVVHGCDKNNGGLLYADTVVGTDSHTTMINGLGVLGWGVGGIEAEAAMLGQPITMMVPEVVGVCLEGALPQGASATDLVLTLTALLRHKNVVGKFVEFYGGGVRTLSLADRATIANMAPEYGATCGYFAIDEETCRYLRLTGRSDHHCACVAAYAQEQGLWGCDDNEKTQRFSDTVSVDLASIEACLAGPKRPQDRIVLGSVASSFHGAFDVQAESAVGVQDEQRPLRHGDVVIAAVTSCTNTSNPWAMLTAGLLAAKASALGLRVKPWVKTSLAPGSQVVRDYLEAADLLVSLESLGFHIVGYGCTTCIGNSGPLAEPITEAIVKDDLYVASVLSGNRNFEGRVHPHVRANYLASPALVVAYAMAGSVLVDMTKEPLGRDKNGRDIFLRDIWPPHEEVQRWMSCLSPDLFTRRYGDVFKGSDAWHALSVPAGTTYDWQDDSTYVRSPPFFGDNLGREDLQLSGARPLVIVGDSITTDHISPAGAIAASSSAGAYLQEKGVAVQDFNSYGARRGNHEVMMRGTFANVRLRNRMVDREGGYTRTYPGGALTPIYDAAQQYRETDTPLIVLAGQDYGAGSSRDWAAKGPYLLGVRAVVAQSFERIHRSNLIGMGIVPLQWCDERDVPDVDGTERFDVHWNGTVAGEATLVMRHDDKKDKGITYRLRCRIDTQREMVYYERGGILPLVLRHLLAEKRS
ncbi:MAG: aconitate hydratase AcnA [Alphaproteobacteria bacterium GM202ARS2]|nr:aconitate hydratase AcnA [Alphaproteobacteria bacterium GM202ARS2]